MMPKAKPGPAVVNVVPGQTATIDFIIGGNYRAIYLSGTVKNATVPPSIGDIMGNIVVKRNGKPVRTHLATELDALNSLDSENLRSNVIGATGQTLGALAAPSVGGTFTGTWAVGDLVTPTVGSAVLAPGGQRALFAVTAVSSGLPTAFRVVNPGQYAVAPTSTTPVVVTSAAGTVGTGTVTPAFLVLASLNPNGLGLAGSASYGSVTPAVGDTCTFIIGIFFDDISRSSFVAAKAFAWPTKWPAPSRTNPNLRTNGDGTQQLESLQMEISVPLNGASGASTCTAHAITCTPEITDELGLLVDAAGVLQGLPGFNSATSTPFTGIIQWKRSNVPYTAAGDLPILPPKNALYQQISFFNQPGDNITKLQVVLNGDVKRFLTKDMNDQLLCKRGMNELGLDPNRFDFVADYSDDPLDALDVRIANEFTVTPTLAAALSTTKTLVQISKVYLASE